jgi:hypothetical protein
MNQFEFTPKLRNTSFALIGIGILAVAYGFITHNHGIWSNLLINGFFFTAIALGALFFWALQYAAEAGWSVVVKRVPEAIAHYLPIGSLILFVIVLASVFHLNHLYHWADPAVTDPNSDEYDSIIAGKSGYLNAPFFIIRTLIYLGGWILFFRAFKKNSLIEDNNYSIEHWKKQQSLGAWFLVFFAVTSSTSAWDWIMSIDTHWFSTLFGWYVFAGMFVSALTVITLIVIFLKSKGLLPDVNDNHIHDLGKFMFAFSIFWTYLWFSQFMLYWYSNIPEEVTYYQDRFENYNFIFILNLFVNFFFPFLVLMKRGSKRNYGLLAIVGVIIILGHWSDTFVMIMPGTVKADWHIGIVEIGTFLGFVGLFSYVVLNALSKRSLDVKSHIYYRESVHHHI